jgi:hypothetical protein
MTIITYTKNEVFFSFVGASEHFLLKAEKTVFRDQKKVFFLKVCGELCKEGRGQTMRGSGQYMVQKHQIQRAGVYMM